VVTVLRDAMSRSSAIVSSSVAAAGRPRVPCQRIASGMAASISSSSEPYPIALSIWACSSAPGPMWRDAKVMAAP
jgi:hypothetical protein